MEEDALNNEIHYRAITVTDQCMMILRGAESAQSALNNRLDALQDYDQACKNTMKKLSQMDRMRNSTNLKQDKVDAALEELTQVPEINLV